VEMNDRRPFETVGVCDHDGSSTPGFDRRAGKDAVVSPDSRAHAGDDLNSSLALNDFVGVCCRVRSRRRQDRRNRKAHPELFDRRTRFSLQQRGIERERSRQEVQNAATDRPSGSAGVNRTTGGCVCVATRDATRRPSSRRVISGAAGWLRGARRSGAIRNCARNVSRRTRNSRL
jgi:hypothetical protein